MKRIISIILSLVALFTLCACSAKELATEKIRDIDFTVVNEEDIPEELMNMIKEKENMQKGTI